MWDKEQPPLFNARQPDYRNDLLEVTGTAIERSWLIIAIFLAGKWNVIILGLMFFVFIFSWTLLNMRRVKKQSNAAAVLQHLHFLNRNALVASLFAFFTYFPFFFANPPMSFLHTCELLRIVALSILIYPYLTVQAARLWWALSLLWLYYALDDILLKSALGERWGLFFGGIILALISIKIIINKKPNFKKIQESPATTALAIFTLTQVILSIICNLTTFSLAKIFGVSAIQCLVLGLSLKVFCALVLGSSLPAIGGVQESRFSKF